MRIAYNYCMAHRVTLRRSRLSYEAGILPLSPSPTDLAGRQMDSHTGRIFINARKP